MTIALTRPTADLYDSWAAAVDEFGGIHIDGSGMTAPTDSERGTFDELLTKARELADTSIPAPDGRVHNDLFWITDDGEVVGFVSFRHELNEWLRHFGGHIGYSVRPTRRRQGYAHAGLALAMDRARELGLESVMLTCDDDNAGSYRTIEGAGGVLQDVVDAAEQGHPRLRRYWIEL
ncbi:GNAT family N-acetyltransferase [Microbacterium sp. YMB-B2]|uniref:GNAT family N-acetyltransferase n=1 Tax=Microbacterium tenebrionis TaxID=2830665 RepID=A0A9X1LN01_9MICO|nr:GNAT family N-acetyltransferase [Microbacterium tenebrionis]MCC2028675.1 GNAT family N-acetyltransferase [Microbacterium tenebrionis]